MSRKVREPDKWGNKEEMEKTSHSSLSTSEPPSEARNVYEFSTAYVYLCNKKPSIKPSMVARRKPGVLEVL